MLEDNWNNWMILAEDVYDKQWRFLLSLRNIASGDSEELIAYKKRQVFCQLMTLQRVANYKTLGYWALILSTAYYGWGVRGSAIVATSFWGVTNSTNYRDAKYSGLLLMIDYVRKRLLQCQSTGLFTYDNIVVVSGLLHQRGRSSKVLSATHMVSHEAREFNDTTFDHQRVPLTYDTNQTSSSPCNMYCYEAYEFDAVTTGVDVFLHHSSIAQSYEPDFTGQRVRSYRNYCKLAKDITFLVNVFCRSEECFKNVPTFIDSDVIHELRHLCGKTNVKSLQDKCYSFKWDSVTAWNPHVSKVTKSLMLGIVGIDEGSAEGAMTCVLDLLLKYGVLQEEEDGSWSKVETDPPRKMMCFGDRTTNENMAAFIVSLQDRPMSLQDASYQADVFLDAVANTQFFPGDWHTGLNMLQSIFKVFWKPYIEEMASVRKLKWSRVSQDVRGCFFQASAITKLLNVGNQNYLIMAFVTSHRDDIRDISTANDDEVNVITEIAKKYQTWLVGLKDDPDHHVRLIANFVIMSNDFIDFMDSIRKQDSIGIEDGYQTFACIWKLLGQSKYLNCFFEQLEMLHLDFPFSQRMEGLLNRTVRTFDANENPDKAGVAQDEYLENCNKDLQGFPSVRSMVGRIRQGDLVGLARRSKRQVQSYYSQGPSRVVHKHGSGIKGNHHLEKDLIFEFTAKFLGDMTLNCSRRLLPKSVANIKCTTDLKRDKLVREMTDDSNSETNHLFNSVNHVQQAARGELDDADEGVTEYELEQARIMEEEYDFDHQQHRIESSHQNEEDVYDEDNFIDSEEDSAVKGYCVNDMWKLGSDALDKMNAKTGDRNKEIVWKGRSEYRR
eukprot:scaffold248481_cov53-Cyclotella_meneghiniana.AAC.4